MSVLILKNVETEGPGTLEGYLRDSGLSYDIVEPGGVYGTSMEGRSALVVLGGPMGVYEASEYPHMIAGMRLMEEAIRKDIPLLGVCLGCQMLAEVLGAKVYKGDRGQEVGWHDITLTPEGRKDPALGAYAGEREGPIRVFHWHGDTFDLPEDAVRLAGSEKYEAQAFRYRKAYGLQFHVEVTTEIVTDWMRDIPDGRRWIDESALYMEGFEAAARRFYAGALG